ncbi:MAG: adenylate/guanylate cyclase domain-containing protein [Tepidisphaeraceae bacterium]|jgi:adenylate cyclase
MKLQIRRVLDLILARDPLPLQPQQKEVTVVFTDLAGFASVSEHLKDQFVLLNDYLSLVVPIVRRHGGYLNKLLGDGLMYFFNAPRDNPNHARDAVASALDMQAAMAGVRQPLREHDLPALKLRCGIATGEVVVGNVGPADGSFSDYTVLGDSVNLASRLETANRYFDTGIMLNDRARELAGGNFLYRPIGILKVIGSTGVMITEALALMEKATDQQKRLAEMTAELVNAFIHADFGKALKLAHTIADEFGKTRLTNLYAAECERYQATPPKDFTGELSLGEE